MNPIPKHADSNYRGYLEHVLSGKPGTKRFTMNFPVKKQILPSGRTIEVKNGYTVRIRKG
jgi:hypothetical protein